MSEEMSDYGIRSRPSREREMSDVRPRTYLQSEMPHYGISILPPSLPSSPPPSCPSILPPSPPPSCPCILLPGLRSSLPLSRPPSPPPYRTPSLTSSLPPSHHPSLPPSSAANTPLRLSSNIPNTPPSFSSSTPTSPRSDEEPRHEISPAQNTDWLIAIEINRQEINRQEARNLPGKSSSREQEMSDEEMSDQEINLQSKEQEMSDYGIPSLQSREREMSDQEINLQSREQEMSDYGIKSLPSREREMSNEEIPISPAQNTDWLITIEINRQEARRAETPEAWSEVCIPRVPRKLRDVNPSAFDPQLVSIGPYYRGKDALRDMDIHKWRCFNRILEHNRQEASLYFDSIAAVVEKAKRLYEGNINLSTYEWVETMVLDGCFLLQIVFGFSDDRTYFWRMGYSKYDPVYSERGPIEVMIEDMLKLENQLPLFILGRLYGLISNKRRDKTDRVAAKINQFFEHRKKEYRSTNAASCSHCLHIYRSGLLSQFRRRRPPRTRSHCLHKYLSSLLSQFRRRCPRPTRSHCLHIYLSILLSQFRRLHIYLSGLLSQFRCRHTPPRSTIKNHSILQAEEGTIHSATKLRDAGVKFKKGEIDCRLMDIEYKDGVLCIPQLVLDDTMKRQIHNLIAFEQTYHGKDNNHEITSYAVFMDDLIDTSADVAYLHDVGIIDPCAGGSYDDAAAFFNKIAEGVIFNRKDDMYLVQATQGLLKKIHDYHNSRIRNWKVGIKRKYFSNPWSIISLIAAIALLVLTFLQTFYGTYGYYRP